MKYFSITLSQENLNRLLLAYQDFITEHNIEHALFRAVHAGTEIVAYKSGTVLLRGQDVSDEIVLIKEGLGLTDYEAIGSDEVGTGDVFGPIIVCSALVKLDDVEFLEKLNIRDSKKMSDHEIIKIGPKLAKRLTHTLLILDPKKYNALLKRRFNLNKIKALLHNHAIIKTSAKYDKPVPVILDKFCSENNYYNYLKDEQFIYRDINFHEKAENIHYSVACAAIIARFAFLAKMHKLGKLVGIKLPKGANDKVDDALTFIIKTKGKEILPRLCKMNYKNVKRAIEEN